MSEDDIANEFLEHISVPLKLRSKCAMCGQERETITKLKRQNEIMKTALVFYADKRNYGGDLDGDTTAVMNDSEPTRTDFMNEYKNYEYKLGGKRARQALKEIEKE